MLYENESIEYTHRPKAKNNNASHCFVIKSVRELFERTMYYYLAIQLGY